MIMFIFKYKLCHVANARGSSHVLLTNALHLSSSIFPLLCILIIVRIIYIYSANLPNPCGTDLPSVTNFPQLSPTFLGDKVVDTNLVQRYLTMAARFLGVSLHF